MKAPLYSKEGKKKGEIVLNRDIFGARINERLLKLVVNGLGTNLRHGTADTKVRKEVRGGGRKPWKQKGTGRARAGSSRSPVWVGGGTVFGPHPKDYYISIPRTMRTKALISALSSKAGDKNLLLLEDVAVETAKTKEWAEIVRALPIKDKKALCIVKEIGENLRRASRNVEKFVKLKLAKEVNAYHIMQREKLLIDQNALPVLEERLRSHVDKTEGSSEAEVAS